MTKALHAASIGLLEDHMNHCVASVTEELGGVAGVDSADVVLATGAVTITSGVPLDPADSRAHRGAGRLAQADLGLATGTGADVASKRPT